MSAVTLYAGTMAAQAATEANDALVRVDDFGTINEPNQKGTNTNYGGIIVRNFPPFRTDYGTIL